jgi:putative two-component system response regulator
VDAALALNKCENFQYDLVFVDYLMPGMNGIVLVNHLRQLDTCRSIPIIMLTSEGDRETRMKALTAGVNDFLNKPFDPFELRVRLANMLALRAAQKKQERLSAYLTDEVAQAMRELNRRDKEIVSRLALAIEARDPGTGSHGARVAKISRLLALGMGLSEARSELVGRASRLHDVGKIGVPDVVLSKAGPPTPPEEKILRQHVDIGVNILRDGHTELLKVAATIVAGHHERWDGSGYPAGLCGGDIPVEARIVAVADVFDALSTTRPYAQAWPFEAAFAEIVAKSGKDFDPACVEVFKRLEGEIRKIYSGAPEPAPDAPTA